MAQQAHVEVGDSPINLVSNLPAGCYLAQVVEPLSPSAVGVLYATADVAPTDEADWFVAVGGSFFTFTVGSPPTWARNVVAGTMATLAIASYGAS